MRDQKSASGSARVFSTAASASSILIRWLVGLVFMPEGIHKLIFPDILGAGRFANIGIPCPDVMGPFVGIVEIVCGAIIIAGLPSILRNDPMAFVTCRYIGTPISAH